MISFLVRDRKVEEYLLRVKERLEKGGGGKRVVTKVAMWTLGELIKATPKRWTGQTRRGWQAIKTGVGYQVTNNNKVMLFLEAGTRAHGPKKAKHLFIPLNRRAALGTRKNLVFGVDFILTKRVKGIKAKNIVKKQRERSRNRLYTEFKNYIKEAMKP
jgi:hypothetical protein